MIDINELRSMVNGAQFESFANSVINSLLNRIEAAEKERDALLAKIAEMEKQEPVAFALYSGWARKAVYLSEIEACEQRDRRQLTADLGGSLEAYRVAPLYRAPGTQPAPSIPDGWKLVPLRLTHEMRDAWIECAFSCPDEIYKDLLAAAPETKP